MARPIRLTMSFAGRGYGPAGSIVVRPDDEADRLVAKGMAEEVPSGTTTQGQKKKRRSRTQKPKETR